MNTIETDKDAGRDKRKGEKRRAIIDAAINIFANSGFHQSRVADIADAAGVADGTIYLYFKSKDDLLITIFEEKMIELIGVQQEAMARCSNWEDRIRSFCSEHLRQVEQSPALATVLMVELRLSAKFMKEYKPVPLQDYLDLLGNVISEAQTAGLVRSDVKPVIVRRALFGALDEIAMQSVLSHRPVVLGETAREIAEIFIRGLREGPSVP